MLNFCKSTLHQRAPGYTMVEILVALTVSSIITVAVFSVFRLQTDSYHKQSEAIQVQQDLRIAGQQLVTAFRHACINYGSSMEYVPAGSVAHTASSTSWDGNNGNVLDATNTSFEFTKILPSKLQTNVDSNGIDDDLDGTIDEPGETAPNIAITEETLIEWDAATGELRQTLTGAIPAGVTVLVENVVDFQLCYLLSDGSYTGAPTAAEFDEIRGVEFSMIAETPTEIDNFVDIQADGTPSIYPTTPNCGAGFWTAPVNSRTKKRAILKNALIRNICGG